MKKEDRNRADARFNKPNQGKPGKSAQDVAAKAVLDNMARLKALRLAREAAEPPPLPLRSEKSQPRRRSMTKKHPRCRNGWLVSKTAGAGLKVSLSR